MKNDIPLLRALAIISFIVTVGGLLVGGYVAKGKIAPIPGKVVVEGSGEVVMTRESILAGQEVFQRYGLMDHGSIWGNGTYRGMDFSAATLHRLGQEMRNHHMLPRMLRVRTGGPDDLSALEITGATDAAVIDELKSNRYAAATDTLTITPAQAYAVRNIGKYWDKEFSEGDPHVGFLPNMIADAQQRKDLGDFFFWTAWAAVAKRPGDTISYTNNWPNDASVGNSAPPGAMLWSIAGILSLFGVLGYVIYVVHRYRFFHGSATGVAAGLALMRTPLTPSQRGSAKFFLVAGVLFVVQIFNGGLLANYTVNPSNFFIKTIGETYAYSWAKTWHLQLGILWIAISWVGTAIFVAPLIAGREPRGQRALVNVLFAAAALVLVGSLTGEVISLKGGWGDLWFWLGHQGWEYLELGRLWQILLFAGLVFWLLIVYRGLAPAIRGKGTGTISQTARNGASPHSSDDERDRRSLVVFYAISSVLVVAFFGFGLMYGRGTHLTIVEYWRWFVVHIWVESIFEFFGLSVIALFLVTLGLVPARAALRVAYLTATLVFLGGMLGTAHHYFWNGGPSFWLAVGSIFSVLEVVPLVTLVVRAWMEYKSIRDAGGDFPYRWPLYFLVASSVWNFVGAAIFGFLINLPIVNYYEHGTYLTSNHAHTALFGVYGMLAISLILFSWRGLVEDRYWSDRVLKISFWGLNAGLALMFLTSLLPIGILQVMQSYENGLWQARDASFYEQPVVKALAMWRVVPDLVLIVGGALPLVGFLLYTFPHLRKQNVAAEESVHE